VFFTKLTLTDSTGDVVSDNFYWLSPSDDFTELNRLAPVSLDVSGNGRYESGEFTATVDIENPSDGLGFFVNLVLLNGAKGEEALPTYWSDNYFSLLPGERKTVTAMVRNEDLSATPHLSIEGWNIVPDELLLDTAPPPVVK
jgi:beta-mannosidase